MNIAIVYYNGKITSSAILRCIFLWIAFVLAPSLVLGQEQWTLRRCVEYGIEHNTSLRSADVNARLAEIDLQQSKYARYPSLNTDLSYGLSQGRSINPTTNQFVNSNYDFFSFGANSGVLVFGWFQQRHQIEANKLSLEAAHISHQQIQDDISLNIATAYLRALLAYKQIEISQQQVAYSEDQLQRSAKLVEAGVQPEINLLQIRSQLSMDSSNYIAALTSYNQSLLQLKAIMNIDFSETMELSEPDLSNISTQELLLPADSTVIARAIQHRFEIKLAQKNIQVAEKNYLSSRAARYPQLSIGVNLGTNFSSLASDVTNPQITGIVPTQNYFYLDPMGNKKDVYTYETKFDLVTTPFFDQVKNNNRTTFSLALSIPIFQNYSATANARRAQYNIESQQINLEQARIQLAQDVLQAKMDAKNAFQVWKASEAALVNALKSFDFASKRYELGLMNTLEFQMEKNNLYKTQIQAVSNRYDYIFKSKVLDFYIGNKIW